MMFQLTNDLKGNPIEYKLFLNKNSKVLLEHKTYVLQDNKFQIKQQHNEFECSNKITNHFYIEESR